MIEIPDRKTSKSTCRIFKSSISMAPDSISVNRSNALNKVLLPDPIQYNNHAIIQLA